jgi:phage tail sheath protein FI
LLDDSLGRRPIEGVPTGVAAFLGEAERGAVRPRLVTSYGEYRRWFGDVFGAGDRFLPYAANGFFENGGRSLYVCRIAGAGATSASKMFGRFTVRAVGAGAWGNRVWARIEKSTGEKPRSFRVKLAYWSADNATPFDPFAADPANRSKTQPTLMEDFDGLVLDPASPDYYGKRLLGSVLATLTRGAGARAAIPSFGESSLAGGSDGPDPVDVPDFIGETVPGRRDAAQGLKALELDAYRDVALVHAPCPPLHPDAVARSLIAHCEKMKFRFAVVDCGKGAGDAAALDPRTTIADTPYAAFYFPWLRISDPLSGERRLVPPGGHVLGVFARTDNERGVFKAPANAELRGALDLERSIDDATQGVLTPSGVNAIRQFPGRGIRVWGARTLSSDGLWKYVSVRRLFLFLERSLSEGTRWVVFEPNNESLWTGVREEAGIFLRSQWRAGALSGRTENEAFFVRCDRTTMTEDDIANGRLICEIGVAPLRPAEFVIFRVFQRTAPAQR